MKKHRRKFTADEKVGILRQHLLDHVPVSDLCDQHGIHPTVFYRWQKAFFENGARAFERHSDARQKQLDQKVERLQAKLTHKDEVIAAVMEEQLKLKKSLGEL